MGGRPVLLQRFPQRRRRARRSSRSACRSPRPTWLADDDREHAERHDVARARRRRPRPRRLGRQPRLPRLPRVAVPRRRPRARRRAAHRPRPARRASTSTMCAQAARSRCATLLDELGIARLPEDDRQPRASTSTCGSSRAGTPTRCAAAAVAVARELERRRPDLITAAWWKEERGERVFVDFNQNAPHKTVFGAWSVRARPGAQVSTPFAWDELDDDPPRRAHDRRRCRQRVAEHGDPWAAMDDEPQSLEPLLGDVTSATARRAAWTRRGRPCTRRCPTSRRGSRRAGRRRPRRRAPCGGRPRSGDRLEARRPVRGAARRRCPRGR